jgi:hypothetical protein
VSTVLCMAGAFGSPALIPQMLGGEVTDGNTVVPVNYKNWGLDDSVIDDGVTQLNTALHNISGHKIVLTHSAGSVAATKWLQNVGPTSDIPAADLEFVLLGNSCRKYQGLLHSHLYTGLFVDASGHAWAFVSPPTVPSTTRYRVRDLARQYDGFADFPDKDTDMNWWLAAFNAWTGTGLVHLDYTKQSLTDPANEVYTEGNVTYLLAPTKPLPMLGPFINPASDQSDAAIRPKVESAYTRNVDPPLYVPLPPPTWDDPNRPNLQTVECADPDHFYVKDGGLTPQPWMQWRNVRSVEAAGQSVAMAVYGDTNKNDVLHTLTTDWINLSPIPQAVYGIITRGPCRVTLQARTRGYVSTRSGISTTQTAPVLTECSRQGVGADQGLGGMLAIGTGYCVAEARQNSGSFPLAPEVTGWTVLAPGERIIGKVEVRFITENYESTIIDGGDLETESSFDSGDTRLDLFAVPIIERETLGSS